MRYTLGGIIMRKSLIRWVLLAVIVLGIIIGGPIIINEFYRNNSGYITIWGAADVLTYYGAIIAASGAAIGVYCSIRYSHKQYREDKRRDVLPYFAINILGRKCVSPFDLGWYGEDDVREEDKAKEALTYREFMYDECFFIFSDDKIECIRKLSEEQEAARTIGVTMEDHGEFGTNLRNDRHYIPMKITNARKGCAINTKITIKSTIKRAVAASIPISIPVGGEVYTGLLFYVHEKLSGKYDYGIQYRDIYGNQYEHHKPITITVDRKNCGIQIAEDTTHALTKEAALNADS